MKTKIIVISFFVTEICHKNYEILGDASFILHKKNNWHPKLQKIGYFTTFSEAPLKKIDVLRKQKMSTDLKSQDVNFPPFSYWPINVKKGDSHHFLSQFMEHPIWLCSKNEYRTVLVVADSDVSDLNSLSLGISK